MIRLLICEDQTIVRQGLTAILGLEPSIQIVGEAANGRDAVSLALELRPDVVLMDIRMPFIDGVEATRLITTEAPDVKVVILSTYDYEEYVFEGVKAGAMGYVLKDTDAPELVGTLQRVHSGETFIQQAVASKILFEFAKGAPNAAPAKGGYEPLNDRELDIIGRLAQGLSNREVADEMSLAEGTIRNYVSVILSKLHAANRVQAINRARQHKLI